MRIQLIGVVSCLFTTGAIAAPPAVADIAEKLQNSCRSELDTYCRSVAPGEGRAFACLYAHSDKLSGQCEYGLYEASAKLEQVISKMSYVADACSADLATYCADIKPGGGRVASCLKKNQAKLAPTCQRAINETTAR